MQHLCNTGAAASMRLTRRPPPGRGAAAAPVSLKSGRQQAWRLLPGFLFLGEARRVRCVSHRIGCESTRRYASTRQKIFALTLEVSGVSNFDLRLAEVSRELERVETHISKQVLCSVVMKGVEDEGSSL